MTPAVACLVLISAVISACGGGSKSTANAPTEPPPPPPPTNNAPVISGSPSEAVVEDQPYEFMPTATDADGDTLVFSIDNQPAWADFDTDSGTLSGTPDVNDVGMTLDVTISVSDDAATTSLAPFDLEVLPLAFGSATVSWDVPTTNADGSELSDLARFRVHYGNESDNYTSVEPVNDPSATSAVINDLEAGTYYFSVTAVDINDNESAFSTEVSKVVAR